MPLRRTGLLCLCSIVGCLGRTPPPPAAESSQADSPNEVAALRWSELLPEAERSDSAELEVRGSAEQTPEQAPVDAPVEELGTRVQVVGLSLPSVRGGSSASFEMPDGGSGWVASLPGRQVLLTPAYGGGRVYVGGGFSSTTVYALDASTGRVDWSVSAPDGGPTAAIYYDDNIYFNTESCTLFAVDASTGRTLWSRWLGDPLMSMPAAAEGRIFSGHIWSTSPSGYGITAMDALSGRVLWQRATPHDVISAPTTQGDSVYFSTMDGTVFRLLQASGRVLWRRRVQATTAPWVDGERLLLARRARPPEGGRGAHEQQVVLDASSGEVLWEGAAVPAQHLRGAGRARRIISGQDGAWGGAQGSARGHLGVRNVAEGWAYQGPRPAVVDGRAYQVVGDRIECRRLEDGELLWSRTYALDGGALAMSPPAIVGSQMVVATVDGHVYGLDIDTGLAVWAYDVGHPIVYQPSVARGRVYVSTARGQVVMFPVGDGESLDGWHMWGGDPSHSGSTRAAREVDWDDPALVVDSGASPGSGPGQDGPGEGELRVIVPDEHRVEALPLEHTRLRVSISGFVAAVTLEQVFRNDLEEPCEAAYHFPLPTGAAVDSMLLRTGDRTILGRIERREQARVIYRQAREAGLLAALLEQQRPNLFTQRVANVPPNEAITVEIHYVQLLPHEDGQYEFLFPMVAGARAQDPSASPEQGEAVEQHRPGTRSSEAVDVALHLDTGVPLEDLWSPSHLIDVDQRSEREASLTLAAEDRIPNRDLVVRYRVGAEMPRAAVLSHQDERGGFFTLMVQPSVELPAELTTRRRLTFAIDTSSSMLGRPLAQAQAVVNQALDSLGEQDELQVVAFSDLVGAFSERGPVAASDEQVIAAEQYVDGLRALGTTSMTAGLERALAQDEADEDVLDMLVLVTDGYVASEEQLLRLVHERLGHRRLFTVGVGPAPNRFLLERLAELGRGAELVVSPAEHPEVVAQRFLERIEQPQLMDLEVDFGELTVHSIYPRRLPDLFAGQPLLVQGRYDVAGEERVLLSGRLAGRRFVEEIPVVLASADVGGHEALAPLWARAAVHDLMNGLYLREDPDREDQVTDLGLRFGLVTRFTSFVAVEDRLSFGSGGTNVTGTIGFGGGEGSGSGSSVGRAGVGYLSVRGPVASVPMITTGVATIRGSLSREIIRRTIRLQSNAIRAAYERRLMLDPDLQGRVEVRIVISPAGTVQAASIASSTLGDPLVEEALVSIFRRMSFPQAEGGGVVVVTYPIVFVPSAD